MGETSAVGDNPPIIPGEAVAVLEKPQLLLAMVALLEAVLEKKPPLAMVLVLVAVLENPPLGMPPAMTPGETSPIISPGVRWQVAAVVADEPDIEPGAAVVADSDEPEAGAAVADDAGAAVAADADGYREMSHPRSCKILSEDGSSCTDSEQGSCREASAGDNSRAGIEH